MAGIYCRLADPPLVHHGSSSSPTSSFSSTSAYMKNIPQNNLKKTSLFATTQHQCGCDPEHCSWMPVQDSGYGPLLHPRIKSEVSKGGHKWQAFAFAQPEPLLHFPLCSGSHSDPAVRVYTPKRLFQQLEAAKEEFIRVTAGVLNEQQLMLPKLVEA